MISQIEKNKMAGRLVAPSHIWLPASISEYIIDIGIPWVFLFMGCTSHCGRYFRYYRWILQDPYYMWIP